MGSKPRHDQTTEPIAPPQYARAWGCRLGVRLDAGTVCWEPGRLRLRGGAALDDVDGGIMVRRARHLVRKTPANRLASHIASAGASSGRSVGRHRPRAARTVRQRRGIGGLLCGVMLSSLLVGAQTGPAVGADAVSEPIRISVAPNGGGTTGSSQQGAASADGV